MATKLNPARDWHFPILIAICGLMVVGGVIVAWQMPRLGEYDPANYVEVARNILAGQGLTSNVVGNFYRRYKSVRHLEICGEPA